MPADHAPDPDQIYAITRPDQNLLLQYLAWSLASLVFFPFVFLPLFFKYHTLRYRFDKEGISMSWGLLFRREINLTYARIQDIHLSRGIVERYLGIASLGIQTASGSANAEMTIQGLREFEPLRDFLYTRMRGHHSSRPLADPSPAPQPAPAASTELLEILNSIHSDLAAIRRSLPEPNRPRREEGDEPYV
ncbi:PH domain-containing protein [bacterium]|nr:PH domain-containing protein [bacterium]